MSSTASMVSPCARAQTVDDAAGIAAKRFRHVRQGPRRERIRHHGAHARVLGRIVGEQQFGPHRIRIVPGARGGGETLPILEARGHMLVAREHGDVFPRQPDDGRQLAQPIVDRTRIPHRFARERIGVEFGNRLRHMRLPRGGNAAIDMQNFAVDERCRAAQQKCAGLGVVLFAAEPAQAEWSASAVRIRPCR